MSTADTQQSGVFSQGLLSMLAYGMNFAASFVAIIGMIRILGESSYGLFALAIQIVSFTSMLSDFGIGPVIMRRMAINPSACGRILLEATTARSMLLIPTWGISLLIGWILEPSGTFFMLLNVMLLNTLISSKLPVLRGTLEAFYRSQSRMGFPTLTMAVDSIVLLGAVIALPSMFTDPVSAMVLYTGSNIVGALLLLAGTLRLARRLNTEKVTVTWQSVRALIVSSSPLALYLVFNALHVSIDTIYLKLFHSNETVGVFNAALRIMTPLAVFPTIVAISAAPAFARASIADTGEQRERISALFSLGVKTLLLGSVLLAGFGVTNADLLVTLAFREQFADAALPMAVLFVTFLPMSLNIFLVEMNNARDRLRTNTLFALVIATISVALGPLLIMQFGASGAAATKLGAVSIGLVFLLLRSRDGLSLPMRSIAWKAAALFTLLLIPRLLLDALHPAISNGAALLCVGAGMLLLRVYSAEEITRWKSLFSGLLRRGA